MKVGINTGGIYTGGNGASRSETNIHKIYMEGSRLLQKYPLEMARNELPGRREAGLNRFY